MHSFYNMYLALFNKSKTSYIYERRKYNVTNQNLTSKLDIPMAGATGVGHGTVCMPTVEDPGVGDALALIAPRSRIRGLTQGHRRV
jgi:hypothetical protein